MTRMVHGDFKPGEVCKAEGRYRCSTCNSFSKGSPISMEKGRSFPECPTCKERGALEVDTVWKLITGR